MWMRRKGFVHTRTTVYRCVHCLCPLLHCSAKREKQKSKKVLLYCLKVQLADFCVCVYLPARFCAWGLKCVSICAFTAASGMRQSMSEKATMNRCSCIGLWNAETEKLMIVYLQLLYLMIITIMENCWMKNSVTHTHTHTVSETFSYGSHPFPSFYAHPTFR